MNTTDARTAVQAAFAEVAPDLDPGQLTDGARLRQDLEIDSLDFLRLVETVAQRTGVDTPESDYRRLDNRLISSLLGSALTRPDPLFLGLDVSPEGALIGRDGTISDSLFAVGPLRKGSVWESTAVPELREQIDGLVDHLLNSSRPPVRMALPALCGADSLVRRFRIGF